MAQLLVLVGLFVASMPALFGRMGRRLSAAEWALMCQVALVGGALTVWIGAALWAVASVLATMGGPWVAVWCDQMLGRFSLPDGRFAAVAGAMAIAMAAAAWREWRRSGRQLRTLHIEPSIGCHDHRAGFVVVTLPVSECAAYSIASPSPQVVITDGLRKSLTPDQVHTVVAHERGHLEHHHPTRLRRAAVAAAALAWWPPTRRSHQTLRTSFERWADEAATGHGRRQRAALRDAIVAVATQDRPVQVAAFSLAEATAERVDAMDRPPRAGQAIRFGVYVPGVMASIFGLTIIALCVARADWVWSMCASCLG